MIKLGEGWIAEDHRVFHACAPEVRKELLRESEVCECGARVPRRVRHFWEWLKDGRGVLIEALLGPAEELEERDPSEWEPS